MTRGFDRPLYIPPFDHRGSFQTGPFGWKPPLSDAQTAAIAGAKQIIYDGFPGFVGFAVGQTWNSLVAWRSGRSTREEAAAQIAGRYREFVDLFEES